MNKVPFEVCILVGSNINPIENTLLAVARLQNFVEINAASITWETQSVGFPGSNFLNTALACQTTLPAHQLKMTVLRTIENHMGRVRTANKNAPRTIDLDIIIFDNQVIETNLWTRLFIILPVSELYSKLTHPQTGQPITQIAADLLSDGWAISHPELHMDLKMQRF
jgi:2-amino-4-hydroxy-6-hydroxymethyldihydropteridine diphosphokinase